MTAPHRKQRSKEEPPDLVIGTINVRGFKETDKQLELAAEMERLNLDVAVFTETYLQKRGHLKQWPVQESMGPGKFSQGTSRVVLE